MGKRTTRQTNTYQYLPPPETADTAALRNMKATTDPTIPFRAAKQRQAVSQSYQNPFGSATSPATMEAMGRATNQAMDQQEAAETAASQFQADQTNFQRQAMLAQMTAPRLVQTGGTQTQSSDWLSVLGAFGAQLGQAALM